MVLETKTQQLSLEERFIFDETSLQKRKEGLTKEQSKAFFELISRGESQFSAARGADTFIDDFNAFIKDLGLLPVQKAETLRNLQENDIMEIYKEVVPVRRILLGNRKQALGIKRKESIDDEQCQTSINGSMLS